MTMPTHTLARLVPEQVDDLWQAGNIVRFYRKDVWKRRNKEVAIDTFKINSGARQARRPTGHTKFVSHREWNDDDTWRLNNDALGTAKTFKHHLASFKNVDKTLPILRSVRLASNNVSDMKLSSPHAEATEQPV